MGISMSLSEEIRRLEISDQWYHKRMRERSGNSAPKTLRKLDNLQNYPNPQRQKIKHQPTGSKIAVKDTKSQRNQHKTVEYEQKANFNHINMKIKANSPVLQRYRRVKENLRVNESLRVVKSNADKYPIADPLSMRARKVRIGKK